MKASAASKEEKGSTSAKPRSRLLHLFGLAQDQKDGKDGKIKGLAKVRYIFLSRRICLGKIYHCLRKRASSCLFFLSLHVPITLEGMETIVY